MMPAATLADASPLTPLDAEAANLYADADPDMDPEDAQHVGYGRVAHGCLPYFVQDDYDRELRPRCFATAVVENGFLRATFLPELGGRLWSLIHKPTGRELLYVNSVFQPVNFGIRNAWFSGGVEWNLGWTGHWPLTCAPLFAGLTRMDDGTPGLCLYEFERVRAMPMRMDVFLPEGSSFLMVRVRLINPHDTVTPVYWWSNIAVNQQERTRVLAPAKSCYNFSYDRRFRPIPYPGPLAGHDLSYPSKHKAAGDYFFQVSREDRPWIAALDDDGVGLIQTSTAKLRGRKLFAWGEHPGGHRWQDFLSHGHDRYFEIQAGLARTQAECLPMPPGSTWEWLEAYGCMEADAFKVHSKDWSVAVDHVTRRLETSLPTDELDNLLAQTNGLAQRPPERLVSRGSGWGTLENARRMREGLPALADGSLIFDDASLTPEQLPWLVLLNEDRLPEDASTLEPVSWMSQHQWERRLESSVEAGRSDHAAGWLHLGVMALARGDLPRAARAWKHSLEVSPSVAAHWFLGVLEEQSAPTVAAEHFLSAVALRPDCRRLIRKAAGVLIAIDQPDQAVNLIEKLPATERYGRDELLRAQAALAINNLGLLERVLSEPLEVPDLREGDDALTDLWFGYHERRIASTEGCTIDGALRKRVRLYFPPVTTLDFRMAGNTDTFSGSPQ